MLKLLILLPFFVFLSISCKSKNSQDESETKILAHVGPTNMRTITGQVIEGNIKHFRAIGTADNYYFILECPRKFLNENEILFKAFWKKGLSWAYPRYEKNEILDMWENNGIPYSREYYVNSNDCSPVITETSTENNGRMGFFHHNKKTEYISSVTNYLSKGKGPQETANIRNTINSILSMNYANSVKKVYDDADYNYYKDAFQRIYGKNSQYWNSEN